MYQLLTLKRSANNKSTLSLKTENDVSTMKQELTFGHQGLSLVLIDSIFCLSNLKLAELSNKLFRWLQVPDPSSNYNAARKARQSGTNSWLLNGPEFLKWRSDPGSSLWLHGIREGSLCPLFRFLESTDETRSWLRENSVEVRCPSTMCFRWAQ